MTECPECGSTIRGFKCKCGFIAQRKARDGWENRVQRDRVADEVAHLAACRQWLINQGITTPGMTTGQRMAALAAYRKTVTTSAKPDPLEWARRLLRTFADGEMISPLQERMAKEALRL